MSYSREWNLQWPEQPSGAMPALEGWSPCNHPFLLCHPRTTTWWLPAQGLWNQALAASLQDLPIQPSGSMTPSTLKHRISIISIKFYTLWYRQGHTYFPYIFLSLSMGSHRVGHDWSDLAVAAAAFPWLIFSQQNPRNAHFSLSLSLSQSVSVMSSSLPPHGL